MNDHRPNGFDQWRSFSTNYPIAACRLTKPDLKFLYKIIDDKQKEHRNVIMKRQSRLSTESESDFENRKNIVHESFVVSVTITAHNGETLSGNNERIFDDVNFPHRPSSVFFSTSVGPEVQLGILPEDRITLFLDFSQPPMLDFHQLPTFATINASRFEIHARNELWFAASKSKLSEFFDERRSGYEWIHRAGAYDMLLFVFGMPVGVWVCVRVGQLFPGIDKLYDIPRALIYLYSIWTSLVLFRCLFSYTRWVLPKVEIECRVRRSPFRHRTVWGAILLAAFSPLVYDMLRFISTFIFGNS